jgi:alkanesulfonate monooxygenase SsuD/methylene tetrahydromethanopterin reductase-like flavin-dependent oxidoreductase (luciferase family)
MHFVVGNPDDVIAQIKNIREKLEANILTFTMPQGSSQEARLRIIKLLGKEVIPEFRNR